MPGLQAPVQIDAWGLVSDYRVPYICQGRNRLVNLRQHSIVLRGRTGLMKNQKHSWMKAGGPLLVLGSVLICAGILMRGDFRVMNIPLSIPIAQHYVSGAFVTGWLLIIVGFILNITGFLALYAFLVSRRARLINAIALVLTLSGIGLLLPAFGTFAFTLPIIGKSYLAGQTTLMGVVPAIISGPIATYLLLAGLVYMVGCAFFAASIWFSDLITRWVGVLFFLHAPFLLNPLYPAVEIIGGIVLLISSLLLVWAIYRLKIIVDR